MTCPPSPGALALQLAVLLMSLLAVGTAWLLSRREPSHRPVAVGLAVVALTDLVATALHGLLPELDCPGPYVGMVRAAFHVDEGRFLFWPASIAAMSLVVLGGQRPRRALADVGALWLVLFAWLVVTYPSTRGEALRNVYLEAELAALFVGAASTVSWFMRGGWRAGAPRPSVVVVFLILAVELAALAAGPWAGGLFGPVYQLEQFMLLVLFASIAAVQGGAWWLGRKP